MKLKPDLKQARDFYRFLPWHDRALTMLQLQVPVQGRTAKRPSAVYSANPRLAPLPALARREVESCNTFTTGGSSLDNAPVESAVRKSAVSFHPLSYWARQHASRPRLLFP